MKPVKQPILALIVLVLLLAAAMRILNAGHLSTWSDEGWNLWVVEDNSTEITLERLAANHHPPAYFLSLSVWQNIAGDSKLALRFLAIAAGVLTVALIYRIGADHFGRVAGLTAATLWAVLEQPVYYGQAVRHYGWLVLGVCLTLLFFGRIIKYPARKSTPRLYLTAYTLSVTFALYTMYLSALVVAVQVVVGILLWRGTRRQKLQLIGTWTAAGLLLSPWLIYAIPGQWRKIERGVIGGYHNTFTTTGDNILMMSDLLLGGQFALCAALIALSAWQIVWGRKPAQLTICLSGIGLFVLMLIVNLRVGILSERTLFYLTPAIALLIGHGFGLLQPRPRTLLMIALVGWSILTPQNIVPHLNTDLVAQSLLPGYSPDDFVLLETGFDDVAFEYELEATLPPENRRIFRSYWEYDYSGDEAMLAALDAELANEQRVWLVYWNVPNRMAARLQNAGFEQMWKADIPVGENDPLYDAFPTITTTLFTRPAASQPLIFGDLFRLEDALFITKANAGNALHIDLWWTPLQTPDRDYSISVILRDVNGTQKAQQVGPQPGTTTWQTGQRYFDRHTLILPDDLPSGRYEVILNVYWYQTSEAPLIVDEQPYTILGMVEVE